MARILGSWAYKLCEIIWWRRLAWEMFEGLSESNIQTRLWTVSRVRVHLAVWAKYLVLVESLVCENIPSAMVLEFMHVPDRNLIVCGWSENSYSIKVGEVHRSPSILCSLCRVAEQCRHTDIQHFFCSLALLASESSILTLLLETHWL